jgi:hypothetical protein
MPGKAGISHATPLHRMDAMRLNLSASVAKLRVIHVTVRPHGWCSFAGTCSFGFPSKTVRLTFRITGAGYIHKQSIFPGPPQRQCCGILCELAAIYRALPIPALPRIDRPWLQQVRDPASWLA